MVTYLVFFHYSSHYSVLSYNYLLIFLIVNNPINKDCMLYNIYKWSLSVI